MLQDIDQKVIGISTESFADGCQICIQRVWKKFLMIFVFDKINSKFFVLWHKTYWTFDGQFSQFCPNTLLRVQSNGLRMGFSEIYFVFYTISSFELNCLDFARQISTSLSTLHSNSLQALFDDNFFNKKWSIFASFSAFDRNLFWLSTITFRPGCQNCILRCWMKFSWNEIFSWENKISLMFYDLDLHYFPKCLWKGSGEIAKFCFNLSRGLYWANLFQKVPVLQLYSDFQWELFWLFRIKWLSKPQLACADGNVFGLVLFEKGNLIIFLRFRSQSHRNFDGIFWARLSKLHSKSLEELCDDNVFW